jgi:hypothetical protein
MIHTERERATNAPAMFAKAFQVARNSHLLAATRRKLQNR